MLNIRHISTSQRCDMCHQSDQFDPIQEVCLRCAGVEVVPGVPLSHPAPLPPFLAASRIAPPVRPKVKITLRDVIHFTLVVILALVLNGGALLVACTFNEPVPETNYTYREACWSVLPAQPKTVEEHLVESFDGFSRILLPGLWFGVANTLLWIAIAQYFPSTLKGIGLKRSE